MARTGLNRGIIVELPAATLSNDGRAGIVVAAFRFRAMLSTDPDGGAIERE
jgi:hypothetical protein